MNFDMTLQTGDRLKTVVAGLVEGTLQLVADPLAASPDSQQDSNAAADPSDDTGHSCWSKVYETRAGGYAGNSGISMQ